MFPIKTNKYNVGKRWKKPLWKLNSNQKMIMVSHLQDINDKNGMSEKENPQKKKQINQLASLGTLE